MIICISKPAMCSDNELTSELSLNESNRQFIIQKKQKYVFDFEPNLMFLVVRL